MRVGRLLETSEVAKRLRCSAHHVRNLIAAGKIKAVDIGVGERLPRWRIPEDSLLEYLAAIPEASIAGRMQTR